jgi:hypothetical protein
VIYLKSKTFSSIKGHYFSFCARKSVHYQQLILWENFSFTNEKTGFALQFTNNLFIKQHFIILLFNQFSISFVIHKISNYFFSV